MDSKAYLDHIRSLPCCACLKEPAQAHHIRFVGEGGMGHKPPHWLAVPLCARCHRHWHDQGAFLGMNRTRSENLQLREACKRLSAWLTVF